MRPSQTVDGMPVKSLAVKHGIIVIATIHQPNWETAALFDELLLLGQGKTMYFGPMGAFSTRCKTPMLTCRFTTSEPARLP